MIEHLVCKATTGSVLTFKIIHNCNSNNPLNKKKKVSNATLTTQGFT